MKNYTFPLAAAALLACLAHVRAEDPTPTMPEVAPVLDISDMPPLDVGKMKIERPVKSLFLNPNDMIFSAPPRGVPLSHVPEELKKQVEDQLKQAAERAFANPDAESAKPRAVPEAILDRRKDIIEAPVKELVAGPPTGEEQGNALLDQEKQDIELPFKQVVENSALQLPPAADDTKEDIESPLREAISTEPRGDVTKRLVIELPVEELVEVESALELVESPPEENSQAAATSDRTAEDAEAEADEDNPSVEPGKVNWHADLAAAKDAAAKSGKPVMLFHLMGQLDQRFT